MANALRVVAYLRISDNKQVANTSLNTQEAICRSTCGRNGWILVDVVKNEAVSANKSSNERVLDLLDYCDSHKKQFDILLVYKLDRFARSQDQHHWLRAQLLKRKILLRSATENISEDGSGKMIEGILAAVNEYDNDIRTERTKLGMIRRLDEGLWPWNPPLGYFLPHVEGVKLSVAQIDPDSSIAIKRMFELYATGCYTYKAIAIELNGLGLLNVNNRPFRIIHQQVEKLLAHSFYIGLTESKLDGKVRQGKHQPIIPLDLWNRCKAIREGRNPKVIRKKNNEHFPLRGFVQAPCDHFITGALSRGKSGARYGYYFCPHRDSGNYSSDTMHTQLLNLFGEIEPPKEAVDLYFEMFLEELGDGLKFQKESEINIEKRMVELQKKQDRLVDMRIEGLIDSDTFSLKKHAIDLERESLREPLSKPQYVEVDWKEVTTFAKRFVTNIPEQWKILEVQDKILYQSSIFPKKLQWDGENYRTPYVLEVITDINKAFQGNVPLKGIEPLSTVPKTGTLSVKLQRHCRQS